MCARRMFFFTSDEKKAAAAAVGQKRGLWVDSGHSLPRTEARRRPESGVGRCARGTQERTMAHYRFNNLLGAPYRGGNLCMSGNHLLTSVGNRVMEVDLQMSSSQTLPCENLTEIRCIAVSPSGSHMISFDTDGRALLVNLRCVPHEPSPTQGAPPTTNPYRQRPPPPSPKPPSPLDVRRL